MSIDKDYLGLYSTNCLNCSHLVEAGKVEYDKCYYKTSSNKQCPASEVRIVITGKALRYAEKVLKARADRNITREAVLLSLVAKESEAFRSKFNDYLSIKSNT